MKKYITFVLATMHLLFACAKPQEAIEQPEQKKKALVVGYLFASDELLSAAKRVDFTKISHLNVAFINPDAQGNFAPVEGLKEATKLAHDKGVKVFASFAGGSPPEHLKTLLQPTQQPELIEHFAQLIDRYNLDGIDVDLEGDFIDVNYESFVLALSKMLRSKGKEMTAAVATWTSDRISDKALSVYDLLHIMSYDHTGPWNKDKPGPHATYEQMIADFTHWRDSRKIPANKLVIGVPFYGYGFGDTIADDITFKELVTQYPLAADRDEIALQGRGTFYYNGRKTIEKKASYARGQQAAGIMIWHLLADAPAPNSLLQIIVDHLAE